MTGRERVVVDAARRWIGTPYVHQARTRGVGCDCLGLVLGVWCEVNGVLPEAVPAYTADWSEGSGRELLWQAAARHLAEKPLGAQAPGDVLLFRMREHAVAKHVGIQSVFGREARFIHAYSRRGVVESHLTPPWSRRLVARFAFTKGS